MCGQGPRLGAEAGLRVPRACSPRELQRAIATSWGLGELHCPAQIVLGPRNASNDPSEPAAAAHTLRREAAAWSWSPAVRSAAMPVLPLAASASGQCARGFLQCPLTLGRRQAPQHRSVWTSQAVPVSSAQLCLPRAGFRWVTARRWGPAERRVRGVNAPGASASAGGGCRCGGSIILTGLTFNVKQDLGLPVQMQDNEPTSRLTKSVALAIIYFFLSV